jgi:ATP/maltotriose-dependent transcriptional regulator MalT
MQLRDAQSIATTQLNLGFAALHQARYEEAKYLAGESREVFHSLQLSLLEASCFHLLGWLAAVEGDGSTARSFHQQAMQVQTAHGDTLGAAYSRWRLGVASGILGYRAKAQELLKDALSVFRSMGDRMGVAYTLHAMAEVSLDEHAFQEAISLDSQALAHWRDTGRKLGAIECLEGVALGVAALHREEAATQLLGATAILRAEYGAPAPPIKQDALQQFIDRQRQVFGQRRFDDLWSAGMNLSLDQAADLASAEASGFETAARPAALTPSPVKELGLTTRELEVLCEIAARKSNAEIAEALNISLRTVTTHAQNLFGKLGLHSRTAAAIYAIRQGLCVGDVQPSLSS